MCSRGRQRRDAPRMSPEPQSSTAGPGPGGGTWTAGCPPSLPRLPPPRGSAGDGRLSVCHPCLSAAWEADTVSLNSKVSRQRGATSKLKKNKDNYDTWASAPEPGATVLWGRCATHRVTPRASCSQGACCPRRSPVPPRRFARAFGVGLARSASPGFRRGQGDSGPVPERGAKTQDPTVAFALPIPPRECHHSARLAPWPGPGIARCGAHVALSSARSPVARLRASATKSTFVGICC